MIYVARALLACVRLLRGEVTTSRSKSSQLLDHWRPLESTVISQGNF